MSAAQEKERHVIKYVDEMTEDLRKNLRAINKFCIEERLVIPALPEYLTKKLNDVLVPYSIVAELSSNPILASNDDIRRMPKRARVNLSPYKPNRYAQSLGPPLIEQGIDEGPDRDYPNPQMLFPERGQTKLTNFFHMKKGGKRLTRRKTHRSSTRRCS